MNKHTVSLFFILAALWLLNSGIYTPLLLSLGVVSVLFVLWLSARMGIIDDESQPIHLSRNLPAYYFWLAKKIVQSNIDVVILIWRGNKAISPCIASLPIGQQSEIGKVIYANSITLTPGTVAMNIENNTVLIHSLTVQSMQELQQNDMARAVDRLEM
ncbi:Na+/H+ antiporter subunit E [Paraglaciecola hydrolytica]|uniref:Cation transporter n=1 Tax=Paraglaciecola hydrolytica TaxID=1799789 RepID=A0A148KLT6_9ALTE|nr:Na+/H+ antiporter subunit E [Paraglaciecola hydrolytica]KXI27257.1 cation transporter [Paraglaciecola hydrolytica]